MSKSTDQVYSRTNAKNIGGITFGKKAIFFNIPPPRGKVAMSTDDK